MMTEQERRAHIDAFLAKGGKITVLPSSGPALAEINQERTRKWIAQLSTATKKMWGVGMAKEFA